MTGWGTRTGAMADKLGAMRRSKKVEGENTNSEGKVNWADVGIW